jgi:quinol monooxygenase YgiN
MDHCRADPRLSRRCASRTQKTDRSSRNRHRQIETETKDVMLRTKRNSFGVFARIRGHPEKADELRRRLHELTSLTRAVKGCLSCEMIENRCDSTEFTLLEEWSNQEAHDSHFGTDVIRTAMKSFPTLLSRELDCSKHVLPSNSVKYGTNSYGLSNS